MFKIVKNVEGEIKKAKSSQDIKKQDDERSNVRKFLFLKQLFAESNNIKIDKERKRELQLKNRIDVAIKEDCRSAGYSVTESDKTSDDEVTKLKKRTDALRRFLVIPKKTRAVQRKPAQAR